MILLMNYIFIKKDGLGFFRIIEKFVKTYLRYYFPTGQLDPEIIDWWLEMVEVLPKGKLVDNLDSMAQVEKFLVNLIFWVTSLHKHFGTVAEYILDPTFTASKWMPGSTICSRQTTYQMGSIAMLTGLKMPPLLGDWTHVLLDDKAKEIAQDFIKELKEYSEAIDRQNATRVQPLQVFNPKFLEVSVSF